jgi:acyl-CoA hydrolase
MEVGVYVEAEDLITGLRRHTNSCYVTYVAIDKQGRPIPVPPLLPETDAEKRRYSRAESRRKRRLAKRPPGGGE